MEVVSLMDFSFLTSEEQAIIQNVLERDSNLKKCEEKRIRKMRRKCLDQRCLKLQTGEWFEDIKANRFLDYSSATDLLKCVFQQEVQSGLAQSRKISCLSKNKTRKIQHMMISDSANPIQLKKGCPHVVGRSIANKSENSTSGPSPDEEISVTQVLKDLELILDLEIKNINSSSEITDINGFSPEDAMVEKKQPEDYSSHQVWHYPGPGEREEWSAAWDCKTHQTPDRFKVWTIAAPTNLDTSNKNGALNLCTNHSSESETSTFGNHPGLLSLEVLQANLSPIINSNNNSGKGFAASEFPLPNEDGIHHAYPCQMKITQVVDHATTFVSAGPSAKPFSSSPCLSSQFLFPENVFRYDIEMSCGKKCNLESSCEMSLDTESTIEQSTIIEVNSQFLTEDHVPPNNVSLQDNVL